MRPIYLSTIILGIAFYSCGSTTDTKEMTKTINEARKDSISLSNKNKLLLEKYRSQQDSINDREKELYVTYKKEELKSKIKQYEEIQKKLKRLDKYIPGKTYEEVKNERFGLAIHGAMLIEEINHLKEETK